MGTDLSALVEGVHFLIVNDRVRPVVAGGSDTGVADPPAGNGDGAPAGDAPPEGSEPAGAPGFEGLDYDKLEAEAPTWDPEKGLAELKRLRGEHKKYRETYGPIRERLDGVPEEFRDDLLTAMADLKDPSRREGAATWLRQVVDSLSPAEQQAVEQAAQEAQPEGGEPEFDPFDREQVAKLAEERVQKILEEREKAAEQTRAQQEIQTKVETKAKELAEAGPTKADGSPLYQFGDPRSTDFARLVSVAQIQFADIGDPLERLEKAAEAIDTADAERAKEYRARKREDALSDGRTPEGAAPSGRQQPTDMSAAADAAGERFERMRQRPGR